MTAETPRPGIHVAVGPGRGQTPGTGNTGRGLPVPGSHVLTSAQLHVVLAALDYAAEGHWAIDPDCGRCGPVMCDDHRADIQAGIRYANLARRLRKAAGHA
jgi:hypothetical protein